MGIFHKDLENAKKAFETDDWRNGQRILRAHLEQDHNFASRLQSLVRQNAIYLQLLVDSAGGAYTGEGWREHKNEVLERINNAERALWNMRSLTKELAREELQLE